MTFVFSPHCDFKYHDGQTTNTECYLLIWNVKQVSEQSSFPNKHMGLQQNCCFKT